MATVRMHINRLEGAAQLLQDDSGDIRLAGPRPRNYESSMQGRHPLDAIYLTQLISADSSVSHALAAVKAWEAITETAVPHNGQLLRDLLHMLSFLHAGVRQFYFQALPDFIPQSALAEYKGGSPRVQAIARGLAAQDDRSWAKFSYPNRFFISHVNQLAENQARSLEVLAMLQRMMAMVGGKFPMVMSIVPGGVSVAVRESLVIALRTHLREVARFLRDVPLEDGLLVTQRWRRLSALGKGSQAFISAGTIGDDSGPGASLFPGGVLLDESLEPFQPRVTENLHGAYYRIPLTAGKNFQMLAEAPDKQEAYSWIKAPYYRSRRVDAGALARLVITHLTGSRSHAAPMAARLEEELDLPLIQANTVAGRLLARLGELRPLVERCGSLLDRLNPGQPAVASANGRPAEEGEAVAHIEAPAGIVQHRMVLRGGRIALYDVISPSTWNGAPRDERARPSGLELALNSSGLDLRSERGRLSASQIVHSYFFSATDAVQ